MVGHNKHPNPAPEITRPEIDMRYAIVLAIVLSLCASLSVAQRKPSAAQRGSVEGATSGPEMLSFDELVTLSSTAKPNGVLSTRLNALLTTPFVHNNAVTAGIHPHRPMVAHLGPILRVGFWNVERGLNLQLIQSALSNPAEFESLTGNWNGLTAQRKTLIEAQLHALRNVDVLLLNEVDFGMKRTGYRNVAQDLAAALRMNYAYGVEFVEIDPVFDLGTEHIHLPDAQQDARLQQDLRVDPVRYRGLHGNAVLSRYPIRRARIFRLPVCYDWFGKEAEGAAKLEQARRWSAHRLFQERIAREVRHGGRMALIVDLAVPDVPTREVTVVSVHLENKCPPACRRRQMEALLTDLKEDKNPVILAGDLNTTSRDNTPTSVRNEIVSRMTDYRFWVKQAISRFHPLGIYQFALFPFHYFHGYMDPTALEIPFVWENRERGLFRAAERFRFADQHAFDFRGQRERATDQRGRTLADSNERAEKGFVPTYAFQRDYWGLLGRFKLDWFFIKPFIQDPRRSGQRYWFAPHFAITMRELNDSVADRISDHPPMTVDLPLREPAALPRK